MKFTDIIYNNSKCNLKFNISEGNVDFIENHMMNIDWKDHDIYEFGTYLGQSITGIFEYITHNDVTYNIMTYA